MCIHQIDGYHTDRNLFSRMAVIAQARQLDMREVLCYPLGPVQWSLSTQDGTPVKATKASLLKYIGEEQSSLADPHISESALLVDAMAFLRCLKQTTIPSTFSELADFVFQSLVSNLSKYQRVDSWQTRIRITP